METLGEELLGVSRDHSFTFYAALGLMFSGWARAASGDSPDALATIKRGADLRHSAGQHLGLSPPTWPTR